MSSRGSVADRWRWGSLPAGAKPEEVERYLNTRMGGLESTLDRIQERLEFGPVPGAYFPVYLTFPGAVTAVTGACVVSLQSTYNASMRPIKITAAIGGGTSVNVTLNYYDGGYVALNSAAMVVTPAGLWLDQRRDFTTDMISNASNESRLRLDTSAPFGSPRDLTVVVWFKSLSKVEPA